MIPFLIHIIVVMLVLGLIWYLLTLLPIPAPFAMVVRVVFIIICILVVLGLAGPELGTAGFCNGRCW